MRQQFPFGRGLYFYSRTKECDFVLTDKDVTTQLIQVCYDLSNPDTLQREIDGLLEAASYFDCNNLLIITNDEEKEITCKEEIINVVKASKWMLAL